MKIHTLQTEVWIPQPLDMVFQFFAEAGNLDTITPAWLHFQMLSTPDLAIQKGTKLEYRLRLRGIPIRWISEITLWDPPHCFVDEQCKGPYLQWIHKHSFISERGGTKMVDHVQYAVPGGIFESFVDKLLVRPDLEKIFAFRSEVIQKKLSAV